MRLTIQLTRDGRAPGGPPETPRRFAGWRRSMRKRFTAAPLQQTAVLRLADEVARLRLAVAGQTEALEAMLRAAVAAPAVAPPGAIDPGLPSLSLPASEPPSDYHDIQLRLPELIAAVTTPGSAVLVVSKGDPALVAVPGVAAEHFPQSPFGGYAGHHPADGAAAVRHLEDLRSRGAAYLVLPATASWWLDHYDDLRHHLATTATIVGSEPGVATVWSLAPERASTLAPADAVRPPIPVAPLASFLDSILPTGAGVVVATPAAPPSLPGRPTMHVAAEGGVFAIELQRAFDEGFRWLVVPATDEAWFEKQRRSCTGLDDGAVIRRQGLCSLLPLADADADTKVLS